MQKILTVIGARPQFIKASVVSKAIQASADLEEVLVHTGQHFDHNMSKLFFDELGIPQPNHQLDINSGSHGEMTGRMMIELERVMLAESPDMVLVYGDTNSTLAGALVASKLHIPLAHVEAGLRSFNMKMPEEINRILTDRVSALLFCPTQTAITNLQNEGYEKIDTQIVLSGDVMQDSAMMFAELADRSADKTSNDAFVLATFHRAENTDAPERLSGIVEAINTIHETVAKVIIPLHPRTQGALEKAGLTLNAQIIEPVGYLEMINLLNACSLVLTDSGGLQKEAFFFGKPCVTMRDQTEWTELVDIGANQLVSTNATEIIKAVRNDIGRKIDDPDNLYGGGNASKRIVSEIGKFLS